MGDDLRAAAASHAAAFAFDEAEKLYTAYLDGHGDDAGAWRDLGSLRLRMEDFPGAAEAFGSAFDADPAGSAAQYGDALMLLHRYDEARAVFEHGDGSIYSRMRAAEALAGLDRMEDAAAELAALAAECPDNAELAHRQWLLYTRMDRGADADAARLRELRLRKSAAESAGGAAEWFAYGELLLQANAYADAADACTKSLDAEQSADAYLCRGTARIAAGDKAAGCRDMEAAAAAEPRDLAQLLAIADTLVDLGCYEESIAFYTQALSLRNVRADTWASCAYALLKAGKPEEARAFFEMAKASAAVRELKWADKLHKSAKTAELDRMGDA